MDATSGYKVLAPSVTRTTVEAEGWTLRQPVAGFVPVSCHRKAVSGSNDAPSVLQCLYSDGLASVSLFVEPYDAARHTQEKSAVMGATHSVTRRVGVHWLTAMGEVPPATLRRFAMALERTR